MREPYPCPCCGNKTLEDHGEFDICNICLWEDDPLQREDPNDAMGANKISLNQARMLWEKKKPAAINPDVA